MSNIHMRPYDLSNRNPRRKPQAVFINKNEKIFETGRLLNLFTAAVAAIFSPKIEARTQHIHTPSYARYDRKDLIDKPKHRNKPQAINSKDGFTTFEKASIVVLFAAAALTLFALKHKIDERPKGRHAPSTQTQQAKTPHAKKGHIASPKQVEETEDEPRPDYSKPVIHAPCLTKNCYDTAQYIEKHAFPVWEKVADTLNWTKPNYMNVGYIWGVLGIESDMNANNHRIGSTYEGPFQFSPDDPKSHFRDLLTRKKFDGIVKAANAHLPVLQEYDQKYKQRLIADEQQKLNTMQAEAKTIQKQIGTLSKPTKSAHPSAATAAKIELWKTSLQTLAEKKAAQITTIKEIRAQTTFSNTEEKLLDRDVYKHLTVQLLLYATSSHIAELYFTKEQDLKENYARLSDKEKGAQIYLWHNASLFSKLVLKNIDSTESIATIAARELPDQAETFELYYARNPGIYAGGKATPKEIIKRIIAKLEAYEDAYNTPPPSVVKLPKAKATPIRPAISAQVSQSQTAKQIKVALN